MKSILHLINELVREVAGPNGVKVVELLEGKENVSEFILSEQMEMNINELRTILYKLTEHNLLTSTRKKDKQKGWYVYYWTFNVIHARDLLIKHKEKQLNELKHKLTNKEVPKYICPHGCVSMGLEEAMEISFKCPECSSLLSLKEVKYNGDVIKKKINEVEGELELIRKAVVVEVAPKEKKVVKKKAVKKVKKKIKKKAVKKPAKKQKQVKKKPQPSKKKPVKKQKPQKKPQPKAVSKKKEKKGLLKKLRGRIRL